MPPLMTSMAGCGSHRRLSALLRGTVFALAATLATSGSGYAASLTQGDLDRFAAELQVRYTVLDNHPAGCADECFLSRLSLTSPHGDASGEWTLYFGMEAAVDKVGTDQVDIRHINGDLYALTPSKAYRGFAPGATLNVDLRAAGTQVTRFYMMPNEYIAAKGLMPKVVASTRPSIDPETGLETYPFVQPFVDETKLSGRSGKDETRWPTAEAIYDDNASHGSGASATGTELLPTPVLMQADPAHRSLSLSRGIRLKVNGISASDISGALQDLAAAGVPQADRGIPVVLDVKPKGGMVAGAYSLTIGTDAVHVTAGDAEGASNALFSLLDLLTQDRRLPVAAIVDAPRFPFRGLLIDVARNFHGKAEILKVIDEMARYKLNKLQLHMADDQGWRLEIPGLPELTQIGSRRCHDLDEKTCLIPQLGSGPSSDAAANGFLTRDDYIEILRAAAGRHIEVIPSLDMPGHSRAAIKAMQLRYVTFTANGNPTEAGRYLLSDPADATQYRTVQGFTDNTINVCLESAFAFEVKIIDEVAKMHAAAGQPLKRYFIGGDETPGAWIGSPVCQSVAKETGEPVDKMGARFLERIAKTLDGRGIEPAAWSDGMAEVDPARMPARAQSNSWETLFDGGVAAPHHQANTPGWQVVLSTPDATYFDMPYSPDPDERGNGWATRNLETRRAFEFMPENLPAHAEIWNDPNAHAGAIVDSEPLKAGVKFSGMQAQLFSEMIHSDAEVDYMLFPRLAAFAERAWHRADWEAPYDPTGGRHDRTSGQFTLDMAARREADWDHFVAHLGRQELPRLDLAGIAYRIPVPGARIVDGRLHANLSIPGLPIEYKDGAGEWRPFKDGVVVSGTVWVRARSADSKRAGRSVEVAP